MTIEHSSQTALSRLLRPAGFVALLAFGGCASLPSSGPTAAAVHSNERRTEAFEIVRVDANVIAELQRNRPKVETFAELPAAETTALIGVGDVLQVSVFEVGAALFSGRSGYGMVGGGPAMAGAGETLPPVVVSAEGSIALPWIGELSAAGRAPNDLALEIARALKGKSQNPQVIVSIAQNSANTVVMMGDVRQPGRLPLTAAGERLLDAIALSGGAAHAQEDVLVELLRGDRRAIARLSDIAAGSPADALLAPGDRVALRHQPRTFTVFGAADKISEIPFETPRLSLAEALARAGGPSDARANPKAIFVFRYEPAGPDGAGAEGATPLAYRLDLMQAESYFLAQQFEMRPRDVIYIANARSNQVSKLIQILNLLFSPAYTAKVLSE